MLIVGKLIKNFKYYHIFINKNDNLLYFCYA